jgi:hypothetical protein
METPNKKFYYTWNKQRLDDLKSDLETSKFNVQAVRSKERWKNLKDTQVFII